MKSENSTAKTKCVTNSNVNFSQSQCIHIINLEFIGCEGNQVKRVVNFVAQNVKFKGQENSGHWIKI